MEPAVTCSTAAIGPGADRWSRVGHRRGRVRAGCAGTRSRKNVFLMSLGAAKTFRLSSAETLLPITTAWDTTWPMRHDMQLFASRKTQGSAQWSEGPVS